MIPGLRPFSLCGVITLGLLLPCALAADPVLTPAIVTDTYGNKAGPTSAIVWAPLPAGTPYKSVATYNDGGLGPMFGLARSFINTCMPGSFPYAMLLGLIKGTFDIAAQYMEIVNLALGFAVCVVIGFLYVFIMPLIGCCMCCCRCCCGNCSGNYKIQRKDTDNKYRIIFSIVLLVLTLFIFVGCLCVYVTNGQVPVSIENLGTSISNNVDDLQLFLTNTVNELKYVASDGYNFTAKVVERDLDNIGYILGIGTRNKLGVAGGIDNAMNSLLALDTNITSVGAQLLALNTAVASIKTLASTLSTDLGNAKTSVDSAKGDCTGVSVCDSLDTSVLAMDVNFNNLPDISGQVAQMNSVLGNNLTAMILTGRVDYDEIPWKVQNETTSVVTSIKSLLTTFSSTIDGAMTTITALPAQMNGQLDPMKTELEKYRSMVGPYDKYRFIAGVVLACVILIVVVLQVMGVVLGFIGYDNKKEAHERSGASHAGGKFLLASVGFVFIFSWLLMLLTVVLFLIGALLEKFLCQPLSDPNYTIFKELMDTPGTGLFNNYFLAAAILQNGSIPLTISGVLSGCQANGAAITVLKLDSMFDLTQVTNYKSSIDIQSQVNNINIDLSNVKLIDSSTEKQLQDFSSATQIDYATFESVLAKDTAKTDLGAFATNLRSIAGTAGLPSSAATKFNNAANEIDTINTGSYKNVNDAKIKMSSDVATLKTATSNTPSGVNATIDSVKVTETYMANSATALIKAEALEYGNRILSVVDSFANNTLTQVYNAVGGCKPVYNLYYSIFVVGLCKYIVDVMNGFWISMGWAILFETVSVIFAIKLAKFLLRMKEPEEDEIINGSEDKDDVELRSINEDTEKIAPVGVVVVAGSVDESKQGVEELKEGTAIEEEVKPVTAIDVAEQNGTAEAVKTNDPNVASEPLEEEKKKEAETESAEAKPVEAAETKSIEVAEAKPADVAEAKPAEGGAEEKKKEGEGTS